MIIVDQLVGLNLSRRRHSDSNYEASLSEWSSNFDIRYAFNKSIEA